MRSLIAAERIPQLFEQAPGFMAVLRGPAHIFELTNRAYLQLVGHRDVIGKPVRLALPELHGQGFFELLDNVYRSGTAFIGTGVKIALQRHAGAAVETRYVNFVYQPVTDGDGAIAGIFVEGSDVTDLFLAQEALAAKMAQLQRSERDRALHLALADALSPLSHEVQMEEATAALLMRAWGCTQLVLSDQDQAAHEARHFLADGDGAVRRGAPGAALAGATLTVAPRRDGRIARRATLVRAARWTSRDAEQLASLLARAWDAMDACRARAELAAEQAQARYIFDHMVEGFALIDARWRLRRMNGTGHALGRRAGQNVLGRLLWEIWPEIAGSAVGRRLRRAAATRSPASFEELVRFSSGERVWLEMRLLPLADGGMAAFFREIGERKDMVERLLEADRRKDEFLAMLAHELRNPLAPISAAADLLPLASGDAARVVQIGHVIGRQARHMTSLVSDLLDVSRVTSGLIALEHEALDLNDVIAESIEQVMPLVQAKRHRLAFAPGAPAPLTGDRKRLVQVVTNLLQNGAKFTPEGGQLALLLEQVGSELVLTVQDSGMGIEAELLPSIFELFTQERRSSDRSQGGLGLGLALVKSLVTLHGGSVQASSAGMGQGASFRVRLPLRQAGAPGAVPAARAGASAPLRLLVVDDNVDAAKLLAMFLETAGHEVAVGHSAAAALETARTGQVDVFLLDIGLPDMDGNELARRLRATARAATFIAVTGYGDAENRANARAAGFDHYFVKPADATRIVRVLAGLHRPSGPRL
jgi:signal transduction histidine kinase